MGALIGHIRALGGKTMPRVAVPRSVAVATAYFFELLNLALRRPKPIVPLLGIELIEQGSQHLSCEKARRDLGYTPHDAWPAVDRAWRWYVEHGVLRSRG
jgi:nucleoside-diphosphate-sugar epimerase